VTQPKMNSITVAGKKQILLYNAYAAEYFYIALKTYFTIICHKK